MEREKEGVNMLTDLDVRVLEITQGKCPYRARACDGLCNNCMKKAELTRPTDYKPEIKIVASNYKKGHPGKSSIALKIKIIITQNNS